MSKTATPVSSKNIDQLRRDYSLYVMQSRAVVSEADGLKSSGRRLLWTARDGSASKVATLAGATMPLHPHSAPEGPAATLAGFFTNNIPLFQGTGAFGTLVEPKAYGAARYTEVKLSKFAKDALFADRDIIPMVDNYDQTLLEPKHFLPLVPLSLLNPSDGIAVGFSVNILPRTLSDIIESQIAHLRGKKFKEPFPCLEPINSRAVRYEDDKWVFEGHIERTAHNQVTIRGLPYGVTHAEVDSKLKKLEEAEKIVSFKDDSAKKIEIVVTYKKGQLKDKTDQELLKSYGMINRVSESMTMVAFNGRQLVEHTYTTAIKSFTDWRLGWYVTRYEKQRADLLKDLEFVQDLIIAIRSGVVDRITKARDKDHLHDELRRVGVKGTAAIAAIPAYGFTKQELDKALKRETELMEQIAYCEDMLATPSKRVDQYVTELQQILQNHKKGLYATKM